MSDSNYVPPPEDSSQSFLVKLVTFMSEDDFENSLNKFLGENASKVEFTPPEEEQKLGTYEIYQNYLKLVEAKFEGFLSVAGLTPEQFQEECVRLKKSDASAGRFLDALIASWDFEQFLLLVQDFLKGDTEEDPFDDNEEEEERGRSAHHEEDIDI
uniref:Cilia- and flagella-associated protein 36 n=1 Tax=Pyramimonas obovata TaxID=1411642 RepID=A0A7S0RWK9_9CHLO|mmetsp:Transcript_8667/g.17967  ORF Transcript_8667/g.17967 Transcript_8667/m.17967 type:complete len:156 (+) Transcript_8667:134-601(+)|eukprot:CAMPEP_0118933004 /NCGR_PEP_ID=MMETSP1169-20130426/10929_1 /TAXON_ID=36882 /ORGANISM="Pyramimonas obovata, Strain CCMP722" /LENGTH=155 /DNA_ID=CAMNT_0006875717 /DNA_START=102 /DNA_END=569 /DNA_ORIENTATION=+